MNKQTIGLIGFVAGAAVGALVTQVILKTKYEEISENEIEQMREYFQGKEGTRMYRANDSEDEIGINHRPHTSEDPDKIVIKRPSGEYVDYTKYNDLKKPPIDEVYTDLTGKPPIEEDPASPEDPTDDVAYDEEKERETVEEETEREIEEAEQANAEAQDEHDSQPPHIIVDPNDEFAYEDYETVTYFLGDGVFVDTGEEPIDDIYEWLGEEGVHAVEEGDEIIVQNNIIDIMYEVRVDKRSSTEAIYGVKEELEPSTPAERLKKFREDEEK